MSIKDTKATELLEKLSNLESKVDSFETTLVEDLLLENKGYIDAVKEYNKCWEDAYNYIKENYPEISHENITNILHGPMSLEEALQK